MGKAMTTGIGMGVWGLLLSTGWPVTGRGEEGETGGRMAWNFDATKVGEVPAGFTREVGEWKVVADETAPSRPQALAQTAKSSRPTYNLVFAGGEQPRDLELSVRLKAVAGEVDQGGGLVWRAKDKENYYIVRYNPLEDNFRVYKVVEGRRTQLETADVDGGPGWHELRVRMSGDRIECRLDGKEFLDVKDSTFKEAGRIGLWTKADAQTHFDDLTVITLAGAGGSVAREGAAPRLVSVAVDEAPRLDGKGGDGAWAQAAPIEVLTRRIQRPGSEAGSGAAPSPSVKVVLRSVHAGREVFFLVTWADPTDSSASHKTWVWNEVKNAYQEGEDREDMCALAFEHTGAFDPDMLSGKPGVWDVWHWKAFRTNPQGFAMDKTHHYALEKPQGKANSYPAKNGKTVWIARPEDSGDTVEKKQPAPGEHRGDRVPQYLPGKPSRSAADVQARGTWSEGRWTLELSRRLDTGNADDTAFDISRSYRMAVNVFDRTGDFPHDASGTIDLSFSRSEDRKLDAARIEQITGLKGAFSEEEGVFKVTSPRSDVEVSVDGWVMPPFMGLTSWAAFQGGKRAEAMVMGDLVLFEDEVNPVMSVALESGLGVTALHNHFFFDQPKVYFMHIAGEGETALLASGVRRALDKAREVRSGSPVPRGTFGGPAIARASSITARPLEEILGVKGQARDGMFKAVIGRTTRMPCGCEAGKEMGVNTWAAFAGTDAQAVVDGDFAVLEDELQPVLKALRNAEINVVAIHHHLTHEEPRTLFLHYWGKGRADVLARGLRSALDAQSRASKAGRPR